MHNVALIGAGRIGNVHARNIAGSRRLRLTHVVDPWAEGAAKLAAEHGARVGSFDEVVGDPAIAGIVIGSATDTHLDYSLAAARAGKVIFCEKPVDQSFDRAKGAAAELEQLGARLLLGFNRRFDPTFSSLHDRLTRGEVGKIESIHIVSHDPAPPPTSYLAGSGGIFKDMIIHDFDMARWMLGEEPQQVFASASVLVDPAIASLGDFDTARTILRTASGRICSISSTRRSGYGYDQRIEAFGSTGMLRAQNIHEDAVYALSESGSSSSPIQNFFLDRYKEAYIREMDHFADVIEGANPLIGFEDGVAALALAEAAARSVKSGAFESVE